MEQTTIKAPKMEQFPTTHFDHQRYDTEVEQATTTAAAFAAAVEAVSSEGIDPTEDNLRAIAKNLPKFFNDFMQSEIKRRGLRLKSEKDLLSEAFDITKAAVKPHAGALSSAFDNPVFAFKAEPFGIDLEATQKAIELKHTYDVDTEAMEKAWSKVQEAKAAVKGLYEIYNLYKVSLLTATKIQFVPNLGHVPAKADASEDTYAALNISREDFFEDYHTCFFKGYLDSTEEIRQKIAQWKAEDIESEKEKADYMRKESEAYQKMIAEEQAKKDLEKEISDARAKRILNATQQHSA